MLKIRLSRAGRHKAPFFRIVLTEHTRPVKSGYHTALGWYDPLKHVVHVDVETTKEWIQKGATPTSRVAKILYQHTGDSFFQKYIVLTERTRKGKNAPEEEAAPAAAPEAPAEKPTESAPAAEEPIAEATPAPAEEPATEQTQE